MPTRQNCQNCYIISLLGQVTEFVLSFVPSFSIPITSRSCHGSCGTIRRFTVPIDWAKIGRLFRVAFGTNYRCKPASNVLRDAYSFSKHLTLPIHIAGGAAGAAGAGGSRASPRLIGRATLFSTVSHCFCRLHHISSNGLSAQFSVCLC